MSTPFPTVSRVRAAGLAAVLTFTACDVPNFEGPQIQEPPQGFLLAPDSYQQRRLFPERELVSHVAWIESIDDFSTIYIDGHRGALGFEDVVAAREEARRVADDADTRFGEVESLRVDGREAWGWSERVESPTRGLVWVAYRAVVPYDTISYAIEFYSGDPSIKREAPDTLRAVIASFAIGRTTYNFPLIAVGVGLVLLGVNALGKKRRENAARVRSINLVKIEKKKTPPGEPGAAGDGASAAVATPAGPSAPPSPPRPVPKPSPPGPPVA
jgi:hypothetical protein